MVYNYWPPKKYLSCIAYRERKKSRQKKEYSSKNGILQIVVAEIEKNRQITEEKKNRKIFPEDN